ncbi:MAG: M20/M25/M40 family metallo-hydrolase, partial [Bacteroidales bacterium]|nr:M20/M25/M40 family metallo-hydrolase [Bacteroidales bacterium]
MLAKETIINKAEALLPELIEVRRHIHRHPELSYAEYETSAYIAGRLERLGIEYRSGIAGTGVVGFIRGEAEGKGLTIALRADMDALPLAEATGTEYSSVNNGVMHACGHDAHVAM